MAGTMSDSEALSLQASEVIDEGAMALMRERPGLDYGEACRMFMAANPHAVAAYAGDQAAFTALSARARATRMALPAGGIQERRFRRAGPPRTLSRRAIAGRHDVLHAGEVAVLCLGNGPGSGWFAERLEAA